MVESRKCTWRASGSIMLIALVACTSRAPTRIEKVPEQRKPPVAAGTLNVPAPQLSRGDRWVYRYERADDSGTMTEEIRGRETVEGIDCYVLGIGQNRQELLRTSDMALVEQREGGATNVRFRPPLEAFRWPLHTGLEWQQRTTLELVRDEATRNLLHECRVDAEEDVTVPAGTFRALRVKCRNQAAAMETWFAPAVRNVVRTRRPRRGAIEVRELIEYRLAP
jgi:hypothetical protein